MKHLKLYEDYIDGFYDDVLEIDPININTKMTLIGRYGGMSVSIEGQDFSIFKSNHKISRTLKALGIPNIKDVISRLGMGDMVDVSIPTKIVNDYFKVELT